MNIWIYVVPAVFLLAVVLWLLLFWIRENRIQNTKPTAIGLVTILVGVALGIGLYTVAGYEEGTADLLTERVNLLSEVDKVIDGDATIFEDEDKVWHLARVLQHRLGQKPSAKGWLELSQFFSMSNAGPLAKESAYRALGYDDSIDNKLWVAQLAIQENQGALNKESFDQIEAVLKEDPEHDGAWLALAMAATEAREFDLAEEAWKSLIERRGDDDKTRNLLEQSLSYVQKQKDLQGTAATLTVKVEAEEGVPSGGSLFVFVREKGSAGQPLAARRLLANKLPMEIQLTGSDWLQSFVDPEDKELVVGARYSRNASTDVADAKYVSELEPWPSDGKLTLKIESKD